MASEAAPPMPPERSDASPQPDSPKRKQIMKQASAERIREGMAVAKYKTTVPAQGFTQPIRPIPPSMASGAVSAPRYSRNTAPPADRERLRGQPPTRLVSELQRLLTQSLKREEELEKKNTEYQRLLDEVEAKTVDINAKLTVSEAKIPTMNSSIKELENAETNNSDKPAMPLRVVKHTEIAEATYGYCPEAVIGKGSFGTVYRAFWRGIAVAVKVLDEDSKQGVGEFLKEIAVLGTCQHESIVALLAISADEHALILVYQLMTGGSLEDRIFFRSESTPPLTALERSQIQLDCLSGLAYLHSKKHLHRDIKSANVLLNSECRAALGDVGLAQQIRSASSDKKTRHIVGTPGYLDPEFATKMTYTVRSDMYSMGIVILELLTRIPSIARSRTILERLTEVLQEGVEPAVTVGQHSDPMAKWPLEAAMRTAAVGLACSARLRENRPSSAQTLLAEMVKIVRMCGGDAVMKPGWEEIDAFQGSEPGDVEVQWTSPIIQHTLHGTRD